MTKLTWLQLVTKIALKKNNKKNLCYKLHIFFLNAKLTRSQTNWLVSSKISCVFCHSTDPCDWFLFSFTVSKCPNFTSQLWLTAVRELCQIAVGVQVCTQRMQWRNLMFMCECVCMHVLAGRVQHLHSVAKLLAGFSFIFSFFFCFLDPFLSLNLFPSFSLTHIQTLSPTHTLSHSSSLTFSLSVSLLHIKTFLAIWVSLHMLIWTCTLCN